MTGRVLSDLNVRAMILALFVLVAASGCDSDSVESAQEYTVRAENFLKNGDPDAAIIEFRNAVKLKPEDAGLRYRLGQVYLDVAKGEEASKELRRALELGSAKSDTLQLLAKAWLVQGDFDSVFEQARAADQPTQVGKAEIHVIRGQAALATGNIEQAKNEFRSAYAFEPNYSRATLGLARVALAEQNISAAQSLIERAAAAPSLDAVELSLMRGRLAIAQQDFAKAVDSLQRYVDSRPYDRDGLRGLAQAQIGAGDLDAATSTLEKLKKVNPKDGFAIYLESVVAFNKKDFQTSANLASSLINTQQPFGPAFFVAGQSYYQIGLFEQAVSNLERTVSLDPANAEARYMLGVTYMKLDKPQQAYSALQPLAPAAQDNPDLLNTLGAAAYASGFKKAAADYLQRAVDLRPDDLELRKRLGTVKVALGQRESGLSDLERAIVEGEGTGDLERKVILERMQAGELDEALAAIERYQQHFPDRADGWVLEGLVRVNRKERDAALAAFERANAIAPGDPTSGAGLALLYLSEDKVDEARAALEAVLKTHPDHVGTLTNLASLETRAGRRAEAIAYLERAIAKEPQNLKARTALAGALFAAVRPVDAIAVIEDAKEPTPELLQIKGGVELQAARPEDAVRSFEEAAKATPDAADPLLNLALALEASGQVDRALEQVDRALQIDPQSTRGRIARARLRLMQLSPSLPKETVEAALAEVKALMDAYPNDLNVVELRGIAASTIGRWPEAVALLGEVQARQPTSFTVVRLARAQWQAGQRDEGLATLADWVGRYPGDLLVQSALAQAYMRAEQFDNAIATYQVLLDQNGDTAIAHNDIAWSLYRLGRAKEAQPHAQKAYQLEPDNPGVADTFGMVMVANGSVDQAIPVLERAAGAAPDNGTIQYHYALALSRGNRQGTAKLVLDALLDSDRAFPERADAEALRNELSR